MDITTNKEDEAVVFDRIGKNGEGVTPKKWLQHAWDSKVLKCKELAYRAEFGDN